MKALPVKDIYISEYELDEDIKCLFIRFPMPVWQRALHDEIDGTVSDCIYMYDELENGNLTYLEISNYKDAVKHDFCDIPFNFPVEYKGQEYMLKDFLIAATAPIKAEMEKQQLEERTA